MDILKAISPLSQNARLDARENARNLLLKSIGNKPERNAYSMNQYSKYPKWMTKLITALCIMVLAGAFLPSSFRLYIAGSTAFSHGVPIPSLVVISGIATVIMAETAQVVASLALAIYGMTKWSRWILYAIMVMSTSLALIGNWDIAKPSGVFGVVDALFPPLLVLGMSYILKGQMLYAIEILHSAEKEYQEDLTKWNTTSADIEEHPQWKQKYASSLRDQLIKTNKRKKSININELSLKEWKVLVWREMQEENWFYEPSVQVNEPKFPDSELNPSIGERGNELGQFPLEVAVINQNGMNPD